MTIDQIKQTIIASEWWRRAEKLPDEHFASDSGIALADHLLAVEATMYNILLGKASSSFHSTLQSLLRKYELAADFLYPILSPVALLHDIGKVEEDPAQSIPHPRTGETVEKRHQYTSVIAADDVLPDNMKHRDVILITIEHHDTPYRWHKQVIKSGNIPSANAYRRLDRNVWPDADGTGLILLALVELADTHGHTNVDDVIWFIDQANRNMLEAIGRPLPVPTTQDVEDLSLAA